MTDLVEQFETWWAAQPGMFANTVNAMYAYCEATGASFNDLYEEYYGER